MSEFRRQASVLFVLGSAIFLGTTSVNLQELFGLYGGTQGNAEGFFGRSITGVGDQNGDGYDDILVANNLEKKAYLYLGGSPMDTLSARVYQRGETGFASEVANVGDVNQDGNTEFAILSGPSIYIYRGASLDTVPMLMLPGTYAHVAGAGDVNGDGFSDLLVSNPVWTTPRGMARIFLGGNPMDSIPDWIVTGDSVQQWIGCSVSGNADLNHDGFKDFAVSGFRITGGDTTGQIKIYFGGTHVDTMPRLTLDGKTLPGLGSSVWMLADVNGDRYDELAAPSFADTGAFLFYGRDTLKSAPDVILQGSGFSAPMNLSVASVGDVNGDGYNDVLTGNYSAVNGLGEVQLYLGGPHITGKADFITKGYYGPWEGAGQEVAWCGDVNHDGFNDLMFSCYAPLFLTQNGKVEIFAGDHTPVVAVNDRESSIESPVQVGIESNYPNPFNSSTQIRYALNQAGNVRLDVFDLLGRAVSTISDHFQEAGYHSVTWNAGSLASGIYYIRLTVIDESGRKTSTKAVKCVLAK